MAFTESSYISYRLRESAGELKLTLRLKTLSRQGTVMFTRGRGHSILQVPYELKSKLIGCYVILNMLCVFFRCWQVDCSSSLTAAWVSLQFLYTVPL